MNVTRLLLPMMICCLLVAETAEPEPSIPQPTEENTAETVLALLRYQRNLCDGIAGKVLDRWQAVETTSNNPVNEVRNYVLENQVSDLAAARAAGDILRGILANWTNPREAEVANTLGRLRDIEKRLCDTVALPSDTLDVFKDELARLLDGIERQEAELGRLLRLPQEQLDAALEPYLLAIQSAGLEAEGNYRDYVDSLRAEPEPPSLTELMQKWHWTYSKEVAPTKAALGRYLQSRQSHDAKELGASCRDILTAVIPLLRNQRVLTTPDVTTGKSLERAFKALKQLAMHCTAGHTRELEESFQSVQNHLVQAHQTLAPHGLAP